ncbi:MULTISPECIES: hypothetical protein [Streptomyces]|uniref:hypothetical protein n=1 Tax=Streptomyces TaxID=1883 RepID=UPI0029BC1858|nr:hypothetical protein [Streptomyces scabiei]MDX3118595.1 hypothetical protein [Streptomyces scabiei]
MSAGSRTEQAGTTSGRSSGIPRSSTAREARHATAADDLGSPARVFEPAGRIRRGEHLSPT